MTPRASGLIASVSIALLLPGARSARAQEPETKNAEPTEAARLEKLIDAANAKTKAKEWKDAVLLYRQALAETDKAKLADKTKQRLYIHVLHDFAACLAAAGEKEDALKALGLLQKVGFADWERLAREPAFAPLQDLPSFQKLTGTEHELLDEHFYRAPDGASLLALPEHEGWTVHRDGPGVISFFLGDKKTWTANLTLDLGAARYAKDGEEGLDLAKTVASQLAHSWRTRTPWLASKDDFAGRGVKVASGAAGWQQLLAGSDEKVGTWTCLSVGLAHGARSASAVIWASPKTEKEAFAFAQKILEAVRQGDQIPKLPARDPGTRLEGVYRGPYTISYGINSSTGTQHWFVFDKRGYATWDQSPSSERWTDLETLHQSGEQSRLFSYSVKGGEIELTSLGAGTKKTLSLAIRERKLEIDGKAYDRVDGGFMEGARFAGRFESSSYSAAPNGYTGTFSVATSSRYVFKEDGTFQSGSSVSANLSDTERPGVNAGSSESDKGRYEVKGDRLVLTYSNGAVVRLPFYPHRVHPGEKPPYDTQILYIAGSNYLRSK